MKNKKLMLTALAVLMATVISSCDSNSLSTSANSNAMANEKEWKEILSSTTNYTMEMSLLTNDSFVYINTIYFSDDKVKIVSVDNSVLYTIKCDNNSAKDYTLNDNGEWIQNGTISVSFDVYVAHQFHFIPFFKDEYSQFNFNESTNTYELDEFSYTFNESNEKIDFSNINIGFENGKLIKCDYIATVQSFTLETMCASISHIGTTDFELPELK